MPRRDAISEKKRERLAQEQAVLQQLMLDARSSVRRNAYTAADGVPPVLDRDHKSEQERTVDVSNDTDEEKADAAYAATNQPKILAWPFEKDHLAPAQQNEPLPELFEKPMRPSQRFLPIALVGFVAIVGGAFYFWSSNQNTLTSKQVVVPPPNAARTPPAAADTVAVAEQPNAVAIKPAEERENIAVEAGAPFGKYTVVSKAYFHSAPTEASRRKAFIIHWNKAVLQPTAQQNNFMYVTFTNHLGQTSKGWLRKKDLRALN